MAIVQILLYWTAYYHETTPAYLWTFPSAAPTPSQSLVANTVVTPLSAVKLKPFVQRLTSLSHSLL